jgi:UDP-N-acetylmuramoyl-L-alanyl-D-glutamate--2,6-diaminopimelate ligase
MIQPVPAPVGRPLVAAVTGTNGKTSVATATLQLMRAAGLRAAGCDSTGITDVHGAVRPAEFRRSERFLPELIAEQVALGAEAISLEAFVGILKDGLLAQVEVDVAVCTGLERDHLDVHGSLEQYWGAKLRLFEEHLRPDGVAVLAADCAQGDLVRAAVARRGARPVTVGPDGDVELEGAEELPATDEDGAEAAGADGIGAGGERDRAKRAPMGAIAAELADLVVLTDDNPRREPPARIRAEVREGCPDCLEIPRRADAIRAAWEMARPGDVVLVAGKGDETVQLVGRERIPHDDRSVLRELLDRG